ncbi:hypothetical protein Dsin_016365 [Dipteronia sinensis]|uniref:Uncharacterized protein n=1 Tax=Dipteronia sinensis TaxID=43782 RepID=A0AAE0AD34_9ROSI|nr:hypothetical protein Dsin_016365 [Dipteronia sinensis]
MDARLFYLGYARGNGFGRRATNLDYDNEESHTLKYIVKVFIDDHSQKLATFRKVSSHRSHRNLDEDDYAQIDIIGKNFIRGCQTFEYMVDQKWGNSKIRFTQKDMYNKIAKMRRSKAFESDPQAAILYLKSKAFYEQNLYCRFNTDDDDRLAKFSCF